METPSHVERVCPSCGAPGAREYCAGCGQKTPSPRDYAIGTLFAALLGEITSYDSRLLRTLRLLYFSPGALAREHFDGRRAQHLAPPRVFLLANVFAWFVVPYTSIFGFSVRAGQRFALLGGAWSRLMAARASWSGVPPDELARRLDAMAGAKNSLAVLCLTPLLALGVQATLWRRGYRFVQHLIFAAHFYCVHLIILLVYLGFLFRPLVHLLAAHALTAPAGKLMMTSLWAQHLLPAPLLIGYFHAALQRAYRLTPSESWWRALLIGLWACTVTRSFFDVAFFLVLTSP